MKKFYDGSLAAMMACIVLLSSQTTLFSAVQGGLLPTTDNINRPPKQEQVYYSTAPVDMHDGIDVGTLSLEGADLAIKKFVAEIEDNKYGPLASILVWHKGKLVFELYANHGYENAPHFMMSVTKTVTSLVLSRAIEMGYLKVSDFQRPILSFFPGIDQTEIKPEIESVTLYDVLMMQSGFRGIKEWMKGDDLEGDGLIQKYFELTKLPLDRKYRYSATDCMMVMALIDELTTRRPQSSLTQYESVWDFVQKEFLDKLDIQNYVWGKASNGNPASAAGSRFRSRDLLKMGIALHQKGFYKGEQLFSREYMDLLHGMDVRKTNRPHMKNACGYTYFTEGIEYDMNGVKFIGVGGRGAAGQFMTSYEELDLVIAATSDNRGGVGFGLKDAREAQVKNLLPLFAKHKSGK
jgi:CubicO group peptidase (beta-lactamase class C family)